MKKTVFILGAGASRAAGAPVMDDFLDVARELHGIGAYGADQDAVKDVLNAASKDIRTLFARSTFNHRNIEELFSAIDIADTIESYGPRGPKEIENLRKTSIVTFIARTIEETISIPKVGHQPAPPRGYANLAARLKKHIGKVAGTNPQPVTFITFNYDTALEYSLVKSGLTVTYNLSEPFAREDEENFQSRVPEMARVPGPKLHGSINWGYCTKCSKIVPTEIDPWRRAVVLDFLDKGDSLRLKPASALTKYQHTCRQTLFPLPFIVPPTWNKSTGYPDLRAVWKRAAIEIGRADRIVVIGYSYPVTDMFFKYLFALGTMNNEDDNQLDRFIVINGAMPPGDARYGDTIERLQKLLGEANRHGFRSTRLNFEGADAVLKEVLPD